MSRFACVALALCAWPACGAPPSTPVILISVDTLRADHLGCYRPARRQSPHIDGLAKGGTLFAQASAPFPLTLPAHVALFTSTYPFANGVSDNGIPLGASFATLATVLKGESYRTAAFVGSFVLDRRFGLNRGFDVYEGPRDVHGRAANAPLERKRAGAQVAESATHWIERNIDAPFFLFLHLYDLHRPYDLASYDAELGYVDKVLGDFLAFLERCGLLKNALIVFTSDHGEGLGDHGESTHGYFIYQSTLHVPLIIHWPAGARRVAEDRVEEPASLLDVAPTILDAISVARPTGMKGRSLMRIVAEEVYSESTYARNHFGCASLRSLRVGNLKYIDAPKPELYDLAADPGEQHNLYAQQRGKATAMGERIAAFRAAKPVRSTKPSAPTPETIAALRSLGYLSGSPSASRVEPRIDPKDRIAPFEKYIDALDLESAGKLADSRGVLEKLRDQLPDLADIRISLGSNEQRTGDYAGAAQEFRQAIKQAPADAQAHFELGSCYFHLHQTADAIRELRAALSLEPWSTRADEALAEIYIQQKDFAEARTRLHHMLTVDPHSYTAHFNLGIFAAMARNWSEAESEIRAALEADPASGEAHKTLGMVLEQEGKAEQAAH